jgi:hypothetical protein
MWKIKESGNAQRLLQIYIPLEIKFTAETMNFPLVWLRHHVAWYMSMILKELVVAYGMYFPDICLEGLWKSTKTSAKVVGSLVAILVCLEYTTTLVLSVYNNSVALDR